MPDQPSTARSCVRNAEEIHAPTVLDGQLSFARAVACSLQLTPRQLPSRFLYDALGSALFDAICQLPWYRVTRAELGLLRQHAPAIGELLCRGGRIVELGSGNGEKLAALLAHAAVPDLHAHLIDLSEAALRRSVQALAAAVGGGVHVSTHQATYEDGLLALPSGDAHPTVVAFLGSNLGNFDAPAATAFLGLIRGALRPGDYLLLGTDLVKPEHELLLAYDDPLGVTAAFNKNLLVRINGELRGDFDLERFAHRAVWNGQASRIEMHLVSLTRQEIHVAALGLRFRLEEAETIWTESSYKYEPHAVRALVERTGFVQREGWIDEPARFALSLFRAV